MADTQHPLLASLAPEQQLLVDLVADAFLSEDYRWPFYDYIERRLEERELDAIEILQSFPTLGPWNYGAVAWNRNDSAEAEIALTVVGMSHSTSLRNNLPVFFELVNYLAERRGERSAQPRTAVTVTVTSEEFAGHWLSLRRTPVPSRLTMQLMQHEHPLRLGSSGYNEDDGSWSIVVTRWLRPFARLDSIEAYVATLEGLAASPPASEPVLFSPLSLAASLDFLNTVWQLTHDGDRLFAYLSAERTTRLAADAATADEFSAHLSAFTDILREADKRLAVGRRSHEHPLARIKADLLGRVDQGAATRVSEAIETLEAVIALRDAGQHPEASDRGVRAAEHLGIPYRPTNWAAAWQRISIQATNAINALREELNAVA